MKVLPRTVIDSVECVFDAVSSSVVSGSHTSLSNNLSSTVASEDKAERKEPVSKSGRRFNHGASGRQYQVLHSVVLSIGPQFTCC